MNRGKLHKKNYTKYNSNIFFENSCVLITISFFKSTYNDVRFKLDFVTVVMKDFFFLKKKKFNGMCII